MIFRLVLVAVLLPVLEVRIGQFPPLQWAIALPSLLTDGCSQLLSLVPCIVGKHARDTVLVRAPSILASPLAVCHDL